MEVGRDSLEALIPADPGRRAALAQILNDLRNLRGGREYRPYPKQREFHAFGRTKRERCIMAGNQLGKTLCCGNEVGYHLTGDYPEWWQGRRFDRPTVWWVGSISGKDTRDNPQRILMGRAPAWGTGVIPGRKIIEKRTHRGIPDALDTVVIRHKSGGASQVMFKSYEQGRKSWQGDTVDGIWFDEEPPEDVYSEGITRTNVAQGPVLLSFTPLLGMTKVVGYFYPRPNTIDRAMVNMTIEDVDHYTEEERRRIIESYPEHEREARTKGKPMLGEGAIFPIADERISVEPFAIPLHVPRIIGIDFGWEHPFAAAFMAHDRERDIVYVTDVYREDRALPLVHVAAIKARLGKFRKMPIAWPHDGHSTEKGTGKVLITNYNEELNTLPSHATYEEGGFETEPAVIEMLQRMQLGTFKVFNHLKPWFDEKSAYHRKKGKIVKINDDLLSATRIGYMSLRHAEVYVPPIPRWAQSSGNDNTSWRAG